MAGINAHQPSPPVMDPETPTVTVEFRGLMEHDLTLSFIVGLPVKARFVNLMPGGPDPRGNDIWRRIDRDKGRRPGNQAGQMGQ